MKFVLKYYVRKRVSKFERMNILCLDKTDLLIPGHLFPYSDAVPHL